MESLIRQVELSLENTSKLLRQYDREDWGGRSESPVVFEER